MNTKIFPCPIFPTKSQHQQLLPLHGSLPSHEMKQRDGKIFLSDDFSHCYSRDEEIGRKPPQNSYKDVKLSWDHNESSQEVTF